MKTLPGKPEGVLEGVIDIGSNSVRMIVYLRRGWALHPVRASKEFARLGHDPEGRGRLYGPGVDRSLTALERFARSARAMGVARFFAVASAAVRNSADGREYVGRVRERTGFPVRILDGVEEARLAALGVLYNVPAAQGVAADMGGGSLELAAVGQGGVRERTSLPIGSLNMERTSPGRKAAMLDAVAWLPRPEGGSLYAVGGAWRALARFHIHISADPVSATNCHLLPAAEAGALARFLSDCTPELLEQLLAQAKIPERRRRALPGAVKMLALLLEKGALDQVVFSSYGLREGVLLAALDREFGAGASWLQQDLLLETLFAFLSPAGQRKAGKIRREIGPSLAGLAERLGPAAALLACREEGNGSRFHPSAGQWILDHRLPGLDHRERAFLALALFHRDAGNEHSARLPGLVGKTGIDSWRAAMRVGALLRDAGRA